jgi:uncharacterized membrane protein YfcA
MITGIFLAIALLLGYATTLVLSMVATFGITSLSHNFVVKDYRIRRRYKFLQDLIWLPCTVAGGYVASWVGAHVNQWITGAALIAVLVGVLWMNAWEMRQRGVPHQIAMTLMSVAGVVIGFMLRVQGATK